MPTKKIKTPAKARKTSPAKLIKEEDSFMEFEDFVSHKPNNNSRAKVWLAFTLIILIAVLGSAWLFTSKVENLEKDYNFKAIYLDNGQTYYAKIVKEDALNIYLDEVYYIQMEQQTIPAEEEGAEPQVVDVPVLVKRGQELTRAQGLLQINRSKLVAAEDIGDDSQILSEIERLSQAQ